MVVSFFWSNVPDQVSLLAFGTKACLAGDVPKVPQGQGLTASVCSRLFRSWSGAASNLTFFFVRIGRRLLLAGIGMPEIISNRDSGILFLWPEARRATVTVAVIPTSGYSALSASMVRSSIALRHISWRSASLSKSLLAGGIFLKRTSPMRYPCLLLA